MGFSMEDVMEVIQIVKECKDTELHIDTGDIKLSLYKGEVGNGARGPFAFSSGGVVCDQPAAVTAPPAAEVAAPAPVAAPPTEEAEPTTETGSLPAAALKEDYNKENLHAVKASVPSVFYRRPSPEEAPFVEVGDEVEADSVLCLLEVMKCYRQVMADVKGRVVEICVESNTLVEEGQTLFLIEPQ